MSQSTASARAQAPGFYRWRVGAFGVIALHEGVLIRDMPKGFVRNASDAEVSEAYAAAGMAADKLTITFTALAVETGNGVVLIDAGLGENGPSSAGRLLANLAAAGHTAEDVGTIVISHFHIDHISGLIRKDGTPVFPKANLLVPQPEWDFWTDAAKESAAPEAIKSNFGLVRQVFGAYEGRVKQFAWGEEFLPGFTAVDAGGHTPGMTAIEIASDGERMMFVADITNNPLVFARHPEWQAMFDMDPERATMIRRRLLDRAAAEKLRVSFYHAPFPSTGFIIRNATAYEYVPAFWTAE
jgi:glyoxylase-like metal-dependent hydrolase (beta-lactamase superfamily II)